MKADLDNLRQLPLAEKLRVEEVLWDDIATSNEQFPLPAWLHEETEHRLAVYDQDSPAALHLPSPPLSVIWCSIEQTRQRL